MTTDHDVEEALGRVRWGVPPEVDARILHDALSALGEASDDAASLAAGEPQRKRRHLVRTMLPAAALLAAAVLVVVILGARPGVTLAEVAAAVSKQPWIHLKYDNGRETWASLAERRFFTKWETGTTDYGRIVDQDYAAGTILDYTPGTGYVRKRPSGNYIPPATPWDFVLGAWERVARRDKGASQEYEAERLEEVIDGQKLVRFDMYLNDAAGRRLLTDQIWADPETRLPVRRRTRLDLARKEAEGREFIAGQYDYPATGPASIYELGVPRDTEVVREDRTGDEGLSKVVQAARDAQARFPDRYMAVQWQNEEGHEVDVMYRNGNKMRLEHYFNLAREHLEYYLPVPATAAEVLEWCKGQVPAELDVFDGEKDYMRRGPFPKPLLDQPEPSVRITPQSRPTAGGDDWPPTYLWPVRANSPEEAPAIVPGCVGLRWGAGNRRQDFYFDPDKGYTCVNEIWWLQRGDVWEMEREYWLSDFRSLPGGQVYAGRRHLVTYGDPGNGLSRGGADWEVYVRVLGEGEFPTDAFDGQKLLEGAKVETY